MNNFKLVMRNGVVFYTIPLFEKTGLVKAAYSTRTGGVSEGIFAKMNFSFARGDDPDKVRENYRRLADAIGTDANKITMSKQVHRDDVHIVTAVDIGRKIINDETVVEADALICNEPGVTIIKHSADCVLIYLLDVEHQVIALIHSGWRSTVLDIIGKTITKMKKEYDSDPQKLLAAIGPSIGPCCFEVGEDVAEAFERAFPDWDVVYYDKIKPHVDLWKCCMKQIVINGLLVNNIAQANLCTACDTDTFFSHRKQKGQCGLMVATLTLI